MKQVDGKLVPLSPEDIAQRAADSATPPLPKAMVPLGVLAARIIASGKLAAVVAVLDANPNAKAKMVGLLEGIYPDDEEARALLAAAGADPDEILRT